MTRCKMLVVVPCLSTTGPRACVECIHKQEIYNNHHTAQDVTISIANNNNANNNALSCIPKSLVDVTAPSQ